MHKPKPKLRKTREMRQAKSRKNRLLFIGNVVSLMLVGLLFVVIFQKQINGEEYERKSKEQQLNHKNTETIINPNRGSIFDRNQKSLAISYTVYNVRLDVRALVERKQEIIDDTLKGLNELLDIPFEKLNDYISMESQDKLKYDTNWLLIARKIPQNLMLEIKSRELPCIYFEDDSMRQYVFDILGASVLGFKRGDSLSGLEKQYNVHMSGVAGRISKVYDANNNIVLNQIPAKEGYSIITTLDLDIQQFAEEAVREAGTEFLPKNSAVIVMNPNTGEILAMAQYPSFNPNDPMNLDFLGTDYAKEQMEAMTEEDKMKQYFRTWTNYNISSTFEPGSIFKPILVAAALEEGVITPNSTFTCTGKKQVADREIGCWYTQGHGTQTLSQFLANSCNVAAMEIALKMGREKFYKYQHDFGYGENTGIDLPGEENSGSPAVMYTVDRLNPVELATSGMGQSFNCTAIQSINAFATVINGGKLMKPYVVSQVVDSNKRIVMENTETISKKVISEDTSNFMRNMLKDVVSAEGTGKKAVIKGYNIGGKTGTGEQGKRDGKTHVVSFIAYLTVEKPEYIAIALIDRPKDYKEYMQGSTTAAPILRKLLMKIIKSKGIKPSSETAPEDNIYFDNVNTIDLPDYIGKNVNEAFRDLNRLDLKYEVVGDGDVVTNQVPIGGTVITSDTKIILNIGSGGEEVPYTTVPDLTGLTLADATTMLTELDLGVFVKESEKPPASQSQQTEEDSQTSEGTPEEDSLRNVVDQIPQPNTKLPSGAEITLILE